jgi:hypothetical protein
MRTFFPALLGSLLLTCCSPTYAPPVRTTHFGAPGHLQGGKLELAGGVSFNNVACGGPTIAFAPADWLQLEGGVDLSRNDSEWSMFFGGLRLTLNHNEEEASAAVDMEFGAGTGNGGEYEGDEYLETGGERSARGLYAGAGIGINADWFSLFLRGRHQVTWAEGIPETSWWTFIIGIQATICDYVNIYIAGGGYKYTNPVDEHSAGIFETGLSIEIPLFYKPPPKKKKPPPRIPLKSKKETKPWPPPVPVKKKPPKVAKKIEKAEVVAKPQVKLEVQPEAPQKPCPAGAFLVGEPPPSGFEMYCAVPDPQARYKFHGWYLSWYGNGQKASEGEYFDGLRHGTWIFWHKNGQKRLAAGYQMGEKRGRWTFWDKDGAESSVVDYQ